MGKSPSSLVANVHLLSELRYTSTTSLTLNEPYPVAHSLASLVPCRPHPIPGLPFCHTLGLGLAFSIHSAWVGSYHSLTTLSIHPLSLRIIFTQLLLTLTWPWLSSHFTTILSYFYYSPLSLTWPWLSSHSSHSSSLFLPASDSDLTWPHFTSLLLFTTLLLLHSSTGWLLWLHLTACHSLHGSVWLLSYYFDITTASRISLSLYCLCSSHSYRLQVSLLVIHLHCLGTYHYLHFTSLDYQSLTLTLTLPSLRHFTGFTRLFTTHPLSVVVSDWLHFLSLTCTSYHHCFIITCHSSVMSATYIYLMQLPACHLYISYVTTR